MDIEDPIITNMERTGYPDGLGRRLPVCPVCGEEAGEFYKNHDGQIVGCDECVDIVPYYEMEE